MLWGHLYYDESLIGDSVSVSLLIRPTATNTKHTTVLVGIYANVLFKSKNIYTHNFPGSDVLMFMNMSLQLASVLLTSAVDIGGMVEPSN